MKYKAIIFDFDDTLVESREKKWAHHKAVAKQFYNIDLTDEDIRPHWGKPMASLVNSVYKDSDTLENIHKALVATRNDFRKNIYADTHKILTTLFDSEVKVGIISAATRHYIIDDLIRFDLPLENFFVIQGEDDTDKHKPDPDVFLDVFEKLSKEGIQKKDILYVGDSIDDFKAASGAGIDFVAVTTGLYSSDEFKNTGAEIIVSNLGELLNFI